MSERCNRHGGDYRIGHSEPAVCSACVVALERDRDAALVSAEKVAAQRDVLASRLVALERDLEAARTKYREMDLMAGVPGTERIGGIDNVQRLVKLAHQLVAERDDLARRLAEAERNMETKRRACKAVDESLISCHVEIERQLARVAVLEKALLVCAPRCGTGPYALYVRSPRSMDRKYLCTDCCNNDPWDTERLPWADALESIEGGNSSSAANNCSSAAMAGVVLCGAHGLPDPCPLSHAPPPSFEEWHARECPNRELTFGKPSPWNVCGNLSGRTALDRRGNHRWSDDSESWGRFSGRTCREVYAEETGAPNPAGAPEPTCGAMWGNMVCGFTLILHSEALDGGFPQHQFQPRAPEQEKAAASERCQFYAPHSGSMRCVLRNYHAGPCGPYAHEADVAAAPPVAAQATSVPGNTGCREAAGQPASKGVSSNAAVRAADGPEPPPVVPPDWTTGQDGTCNSSEAWLRLVGHVERLIRDSAFDLIGGRADSVARLVMANLAHKHNVGPLETRAGLVARIRALRIEVRTGTGWRDLTAHEAREAAARIVEGETR